MHVNGRFLHNAELLVEVHCTVHVMILQSSCLKACTDVCPLNGFVCFGEKEV